MSADVLTAAAVAAAQRGWRVFPGIPGSKRPAIDHWPERATDNPEHVRQAWSIRWPEANVLVVTGPPGPTVIDLDTSTHRNAGTPGHAPGCMCRTCRRLAGRDSARGPDERDGLAVLTDLARHAGKPVPATYSVRTPSGGMHLYYAAPTGREIRNSAGRIGPLIDVRGTGGYIVAAGSVVAGRRYEVERDGPLLELPRWLADLAQPPADPHRVTVSAPVRSAGRYADRAIVGELDRVLAAQPGERNHVLYSAAWSLGQLVAGGVLDRQVVCAALAEAASRVGLDDAEIRATIRSGIERSAASPRGAAP